MVRHSTQQALLPIWLKTSLRHWLRHKLQSVTLIAILALGVASFLSIRMANRAAIKGFSGFTESVTGHVDFTLESPGDRFSVDWLGDIRRGLEQEPVELVPLLEIPAVVISPAQKRIDQGDKIGLPGEPIRILGMDLVGIRNINNQDISSDLLFSEEAEEESDIFSVLRKPDAIFISPRLAGKLSLSSGSNIEVLIDDQRHSLFVEGILPTSRSGVDVPENLAIMDLPALMAIVGKTDLISRVEVIVEADEKTEIKMGSIKQRLIEVSMDRWKVLQPEQQEETGAAMTSAFRLNLTILSLISLLVGLYLITQSIDAAVIQRRKEIGILRALGLLPTEIKRLWLMDLTVFGFLGSFFGIC
jgi:putative ABC transport system permease protein